MTTLGLAILVVVAVVWIVLEGKRQERVLGERSSGRPNFVGTAMLEAQAHLEADRKVETLQETLQNEDRVEGEHRQHPSDGRGEGV